MEPSNQPFRKENDLPSLHDYVLAVNLPGCIKQFMFATSWWYTTHRKFFPVRSWKLAGTQKERNPFWELGCEPYGKWSVLGIGISEPFKKVLCHPGGDCSLEGKHPNIYIYNIHMYLYIYVYMFIYISCISYSYICCFLVETLGYSRCMIQKHLKTINTCIWKMKNPMVFLQLWKRTARVVVMGPWGWISSSVDWIRNFFSDWVD